MKLKDEMAAEVNIAKLRQLRKELDQALLFEEGEGAAKTKACFLSCEVSSANRTMYGSPVP
jgi:hypothetical protein